MKERQVTWRGNTRYDMIEKYSMIIDILDCDKGEGDVWKRDEGKRRNDEGLVVEDGKGSYFQKSLKGKGNSEEVGMEGR